DGDCGVLPVIDQANKVLGVITDRDICMAVATKHRPASAITVGEVLSGTVYVCGPDEDLSAVLPRMQTAQVRRLPVVDTEGTLCGMLSLNDLILRAEKRLRSKKNATLSYAAIMETLKAICAHRS
ncbi:MAG: CBS domain-containing protein, partial [Nitrospinota bacterium]